MADDSSAIRVRSDLCNGCGACAAICPDRILRLDDSFSAVMAADDTCMLCGHCQAVCPTGAIRVRGISDDFSIPAFTSRARGLDGEGELRALAAIDLMKKRRSCRLFSSQPIPRSLLEDLVTIGTTAPSGTNSQPWQFIVLVGRSDVIRLGEAVADYYRGLNRKAAQPLYRLLARFLAGKALDNYYKKYYHTIERGLAEWDEQQIDRLFHGAPAAIIVVGDTSGSSPAEDCLLATQNILLGAQAVELGTCLIGFAVEAARRDKRIGSLLNVTKDETIYSVIACGFPEVVFHRPAGRKTITPRFAAVADKAD